ncbi:MAG TPA: HypC/HybG/HupF family hydrogenase formation chaperone [Clostridiales bacterium]|nr:HypC/HybG/HupF family hydrogenase formation chaperone [Clostridiales bacterium]
MCVAIPAKVIKITGAHAEVDIIGNRKKINILLIDELSIGDKVMVHAGFAISKIDDEYFDFLRNIFEEMMVDSP